MPEKDYTVIDAVHSVASMLGHARMESEEFINELQDAGYMIVPLLASCGCPQSTMIHMQRSCRAHDYEDGDW